MQPAMSSKEVASMQHSVLIARREIDALDAPVFNGDRIIVNKQVVEFNRFDVVVFKKPGTGTRQLHQSGWSVCLERSFAYARETCGCVTMTTTRGTC